MGGGTGGDMDGEPADIAGLASFDFAGVDTGANRHAERGRAAYEVERRVDGVARPGKLDEVAITRLLHDAPAAVRYAGRDEIVEERQGLAPLAVAQCDDRAR